MLNVGASVAETRANIVSIHQRKISQTLDLNTMTPILCHKQNVKMDAEGILKDVETDLGDTQTSHYLPLHPLS